METQTTDKKTGKKSSKADRRVATAPRRTADATDKDEIARRAYALFLQRGAAEGHDVDDWLAAERQLTEERAQKLEH
jgi:hypothetical protein